MPKKLLNFVSVLDEANVSYMRSLTPPHPAIIEHNRRFVCLFQRSG